MWSAKIRTAVLLLALSPAASATAAESLQVIGQAGVLGEWELTANLTATSAQRKHFTGPLLLKHTGYCTQDGPEERKGELQLQMTGASRVQATLRLEHVTCTYQGRKSDSFQGMMRCPDQRDVPLHLWLR
jgi:hypothetical protein